MPVAKAKDIYALLRCPGCHGSLNTQGNKLRCADPRCRAGGAGFVNAASQPVLVDFSRSLFDEPEFTDGHIPEIGNHTTSTFGMLRMKLREGLFGTNEMAKAKCDELVARLRGRPNPVVLVVGGGTVGSGIQALYEQSDVRVVSTDVFPSAVTTLIADAHHLPFKDGSFDAIWIQAVLEHVLEPEVVVGELHRVLKIDGLVYADTPFMQQVHAGAYDFQRFSPSAHRWLFRRFSEIEAGAVGGAGVSLLWSYRYFLRALGLGNKLATALSLPFFWLRFFDRFTKRRENLDAANGVYFFGMKSQVSLHPKDIIAYYQTSGQAPRARPVNAAAGPATAPAPIATAIAADQ